MGAQRAAGVEAGASAAAAEAIVVQLTDLDGHPRSAAPLQRVAVQREGQGTYLSLPAAHSQRSGTPHCGHNELERPEERAEAASLRVALVEPPMKSVCCPIFSRTISAFSRLS